MRVALALAAEAARAGEVPVGAAVLDPSGRIIGTGRNTARRDGDASAHAEIAALAAARATVRSPRLPGCRLVVTLEPCVQCLGAGLLHHVAALHVGTPSPKYGALSTGAVRLRGCWWGGGGGGDGGWAPVPPGTHTGCACGKGGGNNRRAGGGGGGVCRGGVGEAGYEQPPCQRQAVSVMSQLAHSPLLVHWMSGAEGGDESAALLRTFFAARRAEAAAAATASAASASTAAAAVRVCGGDVGAIRGGRVGRASLLAKGCGHCTDFS